MTTPRTPAGRGAGTTTFVPVPIVDVELTEPFPEPRPNRLGELFLLVRSAGRPVASTLLRDLDPGEPGPAVRRFIGQLAMPSTAAARPARETRRLVSIVVCSLGREPRLAATVAAILDQTHPELDVVVVDNDPARGGVREHLGDVSDPRLRVIEEPRRGVSPARNAGLAAARGDLVAFTDDDAVPDPGWISAIVDVFDADLDGRVSCVTGLVTPAELRTREQIWFEEYGGFDKGFETVIWSLADPPEHLRELGIPGRKDWLFPFSPGVFGSGNNMAFRAGRLTQLGGFDEALGAGGPAMGGEDLDIFRTVVVSGDTIVYTPAAHVRHHHRSDYPALRRQLYGYGVGMAAVITKDVLSGPRRAVRIAGRVPVGLWRLLAPGSAKNDRRSTDFPRDLVRAELAGYLAGPWRYLRGRRVAAAGRPAGGP